MRTFLVISMFCGLLVSCGDDATPGHLLIIRPDDGSIAGNIIIQNAVDEIEIIIAPDPANGRFPPMEPREMDGGNIETRVTAAGEWVLRLRRGWIAENAYTNSTTFAVDVPIFTNQDDDPAIRDPTLNVRFVRNGERIAESNPRFLNWPLQEGPGETGQTIVNVLCPDVFRLQCLNND